MLAAFLAAVAVDGGWASADVELVDGGEIIRREAIEIEPGGGKARKHAL